MNNRDHVWANGALVCNCGARRKPGTSASAPPGWPNVPSEPICQASDSPIHVNLTAGPTGTDFITRIMVGGVDLTKHCRGFKVEAGVGALTGVWLDLVGVTIGIEADVPRERLQQMTFEEDEAHQVAQQTVDRKRREKARGAEARLAISLGEVRP